VKTCPTGAISFGTKDDMVAYGEKRAGELQERGFQHAGLYNPQGVGGTHVMYVMKHADRPELVDLPKDPSISPMVSVWKGIAKPLGMAAIIGATVAGFFHYMKVGPVEDTADGKTEKEDAS
jgi:formate dehydrogenase iron-sulfur subunit